MSFAGLLFSAAISDILRFHIPNRVCLAMVLLYPAHIFSAGYDVAWGLGLGVAGAALAVGFLLYAFGTCGGGDAKLFAAVALWAGPPLILPLSIYTTLAGGVMAIFMWLQHRFARTPLPGMVFYSDTAPSFMRQPMPYGAAIAVGGLYVAFTLLRVN